MPINREKLRLAMQQFTEDLEKSDAPNTTEDWIMPVWVIGQNIETSEAIQPYRYWVVSKSYTATSTDKDWSFNPRDLNDDTVSVKGSYAFGHIPPIKFPVNVYLRDLTVVASVDTVNTSNVMPKEKIYCGFRIGQTWTVDNVGYSGNSLLSSFELPNDPLTEIPHVRSMYNVNMHFSGEYHFDPGHTLEAYAKPYINFHFEAMTNVFTTYNSENYFTGRTPNTIEWGANESFEFFIIAHLDHFHQNTEWDYIQGILIDDDGRDPPTIGPISHRENEEHSACQGHASQSYEKPQNGSPDREELNTDVDVSLPESENPESQL